MSSAVFHVISITFLVCVNRTLFPTCLCVLKFHLLRAVSACASEYCRSFDHSVNDLQDCPQCLCVIKLLYLLCIGGRQPLVLEPRADHVTVAALLLGACFEF